MAGAAGLQAGRLGLEHLDELAADDLPLLLRVADPGEPLQELRAGVDVDDAGVQPAHEHLHDQARLVLAQQPVVDEDAGELVADGAMDEGRGDAESPHRPTARG